MHTLTFGVRFRIMHHGDLATEVTVVHKEGEPFC